MEETFEFCPVPQPKYEFVEDVKKVNDDEPFSEIEETIMVIKKGSKITHVAMEFLDVIVTPNVSKSTLTKRHKQFDKKYHCIVLEKSTHAWSGKAWWEDSSHCGQMIPFDHLQHYVEHMAGSIRRLDKKKEMYDLFKFDKPAKEIKLPIEEHCLQRLRSALQTHMEREVRLGRYRLDCVLPDWDIVISIKENDHSSYHQDEEQQRSACIRKKYKYFIEFNAHQKLPKGFLDISDVLIYQVHKLISASIKIP